MKKTRKGGEWALIGDMVDSRSHADRAAAFKKVSTALDEINREYGASIGAPLLLTQGIDELSGVLSDAGRVLEIVHRFNLKIWPLKFRFGVGRGKVDVLQENATAGRMDGPGFHLAAAAIARGHKHGLPLAIDQEGVRPVEFDAVEALGMLCLKQRESWRSATVETLVGWLAIQAKGGTQSDLAEKTGKSQQAVSASLKRSGIELLERAELASEGLLGQI